MTNLEDLTNKIKEVMDGYQERHPEVRVDRDYFPFKVSEEWGECLKSFLMLTDRGRQKGKNKEEMKEEFSEELADVFGFLLLFADNENIDMEEALEKKWFKHLENR
jgi:hypothetical protein